MKKECTRENPMPPGDNADEWEHTEFKREIEMCQCHHYFICVNCSASFGYEWIQETLWDQREDTK